MSEINGIAKEIVKTIREDKNKGTKPYDTQATVMRVEDGTAWVRIPGGVDETPAQLTMDAKEGDNVQVRVSGGRAWLAGNGTSPPTDDTKAVEANENAKSASIAARAAFNAAENAQTDAERAHHAAEQAETDAAEAKTSATNASEYASRALGNLSTVQSVTETLNWITAHGTMTLTSDTALDPSHVYFVRNNDGDYVVGGNHYSVVTEPSVDNVSTYYELTIDESLNNYVGTHLSVTSEGLWLLPDAGGNKVLIATGQGQTYTAAGTYIVSGSDILAEFTANGAQIGQDSESHLNMDYHSMQLIDKEGNSYFYVSDLRDANGEVEITDVFDTGEYAIFSMPAYSIISIVVDDEDVTETASVVVFGDKGSGRPDETPVPWDSIRIDGASNKETIIVYKTKSDAAKAFTFGSRLSGSNVGAGSVAIGQNVSATKRASHAEGEGTNANGICAHSEGSETTALYCSHSEGSHTYADAYGHAEGIGSIADGNASHAEGEGAEAHGQNSHSEGRNTKAIAPFAHAQNQGTVAASCSQTVIGDYNVIETITESFTGDGSTWLFALGYSVFEIQSVLIDGVEQSSNSFTLSRNSIKFKTTPAIGAQIEVTYVSTTAPRGDYALIIGNGTSNNARSNALTVDWQGNVKTAGSVTENNGTRDIDLTISEATIQKYVNLGMSLT